MAAGGFLLKNRNISDLYKNLKCFFFNFGFIWYSDIYKKYIFNHHIYIRTLTAVA